jgi:hypothetical protein
MPSSLPDFIRVHRSYFAPIMSSARPYIEASHLACTVSNTAFALLVVEAAGTAPASDHGPSRYSEPSLLTERAIKTISPRVKPSQGLSFSVDAEDHA